MECFKVRKDGLVRVLKDDALVDLVDIPTFIKKQKSAQINTEHCHICGKTNHVLELEHVENSVGGYDHFCTYCGEKLFTGFCQGCPECQAQARRQRPVFRLASCKKLRKRCEDALRKTAKMEEIFQVAKILGVKID